MTTLPQTTSIQLPRPASAGTLAPVAAPTAAPAYHGQMTGGDVWRILKSNIWLIIGSLIAAIVIGFGLNWYLQQYHARYTATGYVQIQSQSNWSPLSNSQQMMGDTTDSLIVEQRSQATMLTTDALFTQVLSQADSPTRQTSWFNQFKKSDGSVDVAAAKEDLRKEFTATPIPDSKLIAVSFTYNKATDCPVIVKDIVSQHIANEQKRNNDKSLDKQGFLRLMVSRYENQLKELRSDTNMIASQLQLDGYGRPGGFSQKEAELQQAITRQLEAETEARAVQSAYDTAKQQLQEGATPAAVESMVEQNSMVMQRKSQVDDLDIAIRAIQNMGTDNKDYKELMARREATQDKLDELRAEERSNDTVAYMEKLTGDVSQAQQVLEGLNKQIDKAKNDLADLTNKLSDYLTKKEEEAGYDELLRRTRDQLDLLTNLSAHNSMNTIDWGPMPETPDTPSFPQLPYILSGCIALGLMLSVGLAFLREVADTSVRSPRDIARVGQMNLLGMIPHEDDDPQAAGTPLSTVIYAAPTSMLAEQYRQVRTRLQHTASLDTTRSLLVTSPSPGDGKTTVAANLAAGLALNGRKILLVDANFRRPELHKIFGMENQAGFGNVLSSIDNFESSIRQTKVPNLDVMTSGPKPANATELLESQLLIDFIERALEEYDHVIFDSGPMLVVSETVALAPRVDGVITVVRARNNSRGLLQRMRDGLRQLKAEHLGVVLNGVRSTGGGYYGRNIKTYYEYQNGQEA